MREKGGERCERPKRKKRRMVKETRMRKRMGWMRGCRMRVESTPPGTALVMMPKRFWTGMQATRSC